MNLSTLAFSSSTESCGPPSSFRPTKSMICWVFWPKMYLSPRDSTGTVRRPSFCSWAIPSSSRTLTEMKSIPRTDRNSLSLRQLVQPGCQKTLNGSLIAFLQNRDPSLLQDALAQQGMMRRTQPAAERDGNDIHAPLAQLGDHVGVIARHHHA